MNIMSIGDMAQGLVLRSRGAQLKQSIETLTGELSSGRVADVSARLGNDFSYLTEIDHNLSRLSAFSVAATEAQSFAEAAQSRLERLNDVASALSGTLISLAPSNLNSVQQNVHVQALSGLDSAISALNGSLAGRSLFSGTSTDRAPLAAAGQMITSLNGEIAGLSSPIAILQAVNNWFSDPAGFEAVMYAGASQSLSPLQVGPGQHVGMTLRADDPAFRSLFRNIAVTAIAVDPGSGFDEATRNALLADAGSGLLSDQDRMVSLRSDLGFAEARIEEAIVRNASARTGLEYAKGALLEADPYETATRLEETQFRLESLYTATVRTSRLSLVNFL